MKLNHHLHRALLPTVCIGLLLVTAIVSCQKELNFDKGPQSDHNIILKFKPIVQFDSVPLEFGKAYTNSFKESFTPTTFKFYVHGIELINTDSNRVFRVPDKYYLVDFADSTTTEIKVAVLPYVYNRIAFTIGVDSATIASGNQTGALDPALGMYKDPATGYIMAKLEGTSSKSGQGGKFEYSISGFSGVNNAIQRVERLFPFPQNIDLKPGKSTQMFILADAYDWFYNPHDIKIAVNPVITTPGELAKQVAENYQKMFTVDSVANN